MKIEGSGPYISLMTCAVYDVYGPVPKYFSIVRLSNTYTSPELEYKSLRNKIAEDNKLSESSLATVCYIPPCLNAVQHHNRKYFAFFLLSATNPGLSYAHSPLSLELIPLNNDIFFITKALDLAIDEAHSRVSFRGYSRDEIHIASMSLSPMMSTS